MGLVAYLNRILPLLNHFSQSLFSSSYKKAIAHKKADEWYLTFIFIRCMAGLPFYKKSDFEYYYYCLDSDGKKWSFLF